MLENMYHNMTYEELARETMRSDYKLAKAVLEKCDETLEIERSGFEALKTGTSTAFDTTRTLFQY